MFDLCTRGPDLLAVDKTLRSKLPAFSLKKAAELLVISSLNICAYIHACLCEMIDLHHSYEHLAYFWSKM